MASRRAAPRLIEAIADEPKSILDRLRANLVHADQLGNLPKPEPLIADVLDAGSFASLFGPSGAGKSFVAIDWSLSIATGTWWLRRHQVQQGPVLYIVGEGSFGLDARITAWQTHQHGQARGDLSFLVQPVNLLNPAWSTGLVELARELQPVLIVVDTLSRSMPGGNENASEDMTRIVDAADRLRNTVGACVLLVHHTGKDLSAGSRGHSSLKGALDTEIKCEGSDHTVTLRAEKQRNHPDGHVIERLQLVPVGDSCALEASTTAAPPTTPTSPPKTEPPSTPSPPSRYQAVSPSPNGAKRPSQRLVSAKDHSHATAVDCSTPARSLTSVHRSDLATSPPPSITLVSARCHDTGSRMVSPGITPLRGDT